MKLFPPEPSVDLYNEGFAGDDFLNRRPTGAALSDLIERIEDPLVVVLDGPWGSGKSHFLKRWVGAHVNENHGTANTVYFDAFANDFLDDPLTGLAGAITNRLPAGTKQSAKSALKGAAATLARPAIRMGLAVATAGISEVTGTLMDAAVSAGGSEMDKAVESFWRREEGRREAMRQVEKSLKEITSGNEGEPKKLAIVVDELDRCRPDYSLAILETIKHFFAVPNVHFILGVNMSALQHSVRARYGGEMDAEGYLRRFVSLTMSLPDIVERHDGGSASAAYFKRQAESMSLPKDLAQAVDRYIQIGGAASHASLRDLNKVLGLCALMPRRDGFGQLPWGYQELVASLLLMKALDAQLFAKVRNGKISMAEIHSFLGTTKEDLIESPHNSSMQARYAHIAAGVWDFVINPKDDLSDSIFSSAFGSYSHFGRNVDIGNTARDFFDTFSFPES